MESDGKEAPPKKTRRVKKQVRKGDLPISSGTSSLDGAAKSALMEKESGMVMEDKLVADTEEKKNELETYIYDLRAKLDDQYAEFASEEEKSTIKQRLEAAEVSESPQIYHHRRLRITLTLLFSCRTGCMTRARRRPRASTSRSLRSSAAWLAPLCSVILRKSRQSDVLRKSDSRPSRLPKEPLRKRLARLLRPRRRLNREVTRK